jgi:SAM-dependent methyltransferase
MSVTYDLDGQKKVYRIWARFYDKIYVGLLARAQREAVDAAVACGRDILEIGVGTGLTLPYFPADRRVVGVDLSEDMLRVAGQKVAERKLTAVTGLSVMDACRLGLPDEAFNAVTAQFVITLVPDPEQALRAQARRRDRDFKPAGGFRRGQRSLMVSARAARQGRGLEHRFQGQPPDGLGRANRALPDGACRTRLFQGCQAEEAGKQAGLTGQPAGLVMRCLYRTGAEGNW